MTQVEQVDPDTDKYLTEDDSSADGRYGITDMGERFRLPTTKDPFGMPSFKEFDWYEFMRFSGVFYLVPMLLFGVPSWVFVVVFVFWRLMYNGFLGWILYKQSNEKMLTKYFEPIPDHPINDLTKSALEALMGDDYDYNESPAELNAWVFFRCIVEIILSNDLCSYFAMCLSLIDFSAGFTVSTVLQYIVGIILCLFAMWAKHDAYVVIKDFAWYWGDFFFLVEADLTFNRVFSIFPHPMYTLGYMFYYGASLLTQSYTVLYISLFAHFCQLFFLSVVEDPHIVKTYGPLVEKEESESRDVEYSYFRKDLIVFKNFNMFRSSDFSLLIIIGYNIWILIFDIPQWYFILQVVISRIFHTVCLGGILYFQWKDNFWNNYFISEGLDKKLAFEEWKRLFNLSLTLQYFTFVVCAIKLGDYATMFSMTFVLQLTFGGLLIALNIWSSASTFDILGEYGWFYGDYFIDDIRPETVYYSGIYRYLNNPENVTGFAGFYGVAIISGNWILFALALFSQILNLLFCNLVDTPHMRELYGNSLREIAGFEEGIQEIIEHEKTKLNTTIAQTKEDLNHSTNLLKTRIQRTATKLRLSTAKERLEKSSCTIL